MGTTGDAQEKTFAQAERGARRRRMLRSGLMSVAVVVAVLLAWAAVYNLDATGRIWGGAPKHVSYCGREYAGSGSGSTFAQVRAFYDKLDPNGTASFHLVKVGTYPWLIGDSLYVAAPFDTSRPRAPGEVCTMVVWVRVGPDSYAGYDLEGGP